MLSIHYDKQPDATTKKTFQNLGWKQKLQFIWDYYKLPLAIVCIALYIAIYSIYGHLTYKQTVLYTALVNVAAGEQLTYHLTEAFLESANIDCSKNKCQLYSGLYLTEDETNAYHAYTYASEMKILASIDAKQMDLVLMDQEALDAFAQNEYLYDLDFFLSKETALYETIRPYVVKSTAINLSACPMIQAAGFSDTVYLGIIKNTSHQETVLKFLKYLYPM